MYDAGLSFRFARSIKAEASAERVLERFGGIDSRKWRGRVSTFISSSRAFSLGVRADWGDEIFFDPDDPCLGRQTSVGVDATLRPSSSVQTRLSLEAARFNDVRTGPLEVFDVKIWRGLTTWQLTERFLLRNITEYKHVHEGARFQSVAHLSRQRRNGVLFWLRRSLPSGGSLRRRSLLHHRSETHEPRDRHEAAVSLPVLVSTGSFSVSTRTSV